MKYLKLKETLPYLLILAGFYAVLLALTYFLDFEAGEATRVVLLEWGAFPMLSAIVGGVMAQKIGFMPIYGAFAGIIFVPMMYLCFVEKNWYVVLMYVVFGYVGELFGAFLHYKEVKRIEEGKPPKEYRRPFWFKLFDRHDIDQYK